MSAGIQHLLQGNKNRIGEARVDKIETDRFNSIVERISGVNPSKLAAEVTGKGRAEANAYDHLQPGSPPEARQMMEQAPQAHHGIYGAGPAADLAASRRQASNQGGDQQVAMLARQVAMLEQRLAKYEVFNGNDNDVVSTSNKPAQGPSNRGPDSMAFARDIDPKKAKTKDPADGKPDKPKATKTPEGQMPAEHKNILGISMTEWREMAGLKAPAVDLTARPAVQESYEDEVDGEAPVEIQDVEIQDDEDEVNENENRLWAQFLTVYNTTPEEMAAFVEAADRNKDVEALLAIQELEDEFVESMKGDADDLGALWAEWLEARGLSTDTFDALVEAASTDDELETLEALQAMFEAEISGQRVAGSSPVPSGSSDVHEPGKKPVTATSVARSGGAIKPSRKGNFSLPASMRKKMGMAPEERKEDVEEDDTFECDSDEGGGPDMKHPGWAKAMKKFKIRRKS